MKTTQFLSIGAVLAMVSAQSLDSLPACGKLCVNNMLAKAKELGCADGDTACLCRNVDFAYGIRDCSIDVCGPTEAKSVIAYGESFCKNSGTGGNGGNVGTGDGNVTSTISGPVTTSTGSLVPSSSLESLSLPEATITASKTEASAAIVTSALVSLVTSGSGVQTTTLGFTTIFGTSSGTTTPSASSSSSESSPTSSEGESTSTSSGSGARQTAYVGLAAAAGLAAMIL